MSDPPRGERFVADLIDSIYFSPHKHCEMLGELHKVLYYLHLTWAEIKDIRPSYDHQRVRNHIALGFNALTGPVTSGNRTNFIESALSEGVTEVIAYWKTLDDRIGLTTSLTNSD